MGARRTPWCMESAATACVTAVRYLFGQSCCGLAGLTLAFPAPLPFPQSCGGGGGGGGGGGFCDAQTAGAASSPQASTVPMSPGEPSTTLSVQVPDSGAPSSDESGSAGLNDPVNGAAVVDLMAEAALSSNTVSTKSSPLDPFPLTSRTDRPSGAISVSVRSAS